MKLSIIIDADGTIAIQQVDKLGKSVKAAGDATDKMAAKSKTAASETTTLGQSAGVADAQVDGLSAAQARNAQAAQAMAASHRMASGSMGNLVAQGNDVVVMAIAMQNPLMLAMQQGTQITQVIGPLGAAGAFKALKGALLQMLNPVSLVTIGALAGGVALVQWAISAAGADEKADTLKEGMQALREETEGAKEEFELYSRGLDSVNQLVALDAIAAQEQKVAEARERLERARGNATVGAAQNLAAAERELQVLKDALAARNEAVNKLEAQSNFQDRITAAIERGAVVQQTRATELQQAKDLLATMVEQNTLQLAINTHGADSVEVTALRAASERDAFDEMLATMGVSQELKDQLYGAFLISQDIANADLGVGIRSAVADAATLAQNLRLAATFSGEDAAMNVAVIPGATGNQANNRAVDSLRRLTKPPSERSGGGRSGPSPAAREAKRQRDAVENLTQGLTDELAILKESDPIQKEMLRNREALVAATSQERKTIEEMIRMRNAETASLELQEEQWGAARGAAVGFFDDLRASGGSLESALSGVVDRLVDMVFQATLLGEGPLAGILGGGSGGVVGTLLGAAFPSIAPANLNKIPAKARGGDIVGPGTGTSDDVLMWGSNGEFVATAQATSKYRPILEAMNAGTLSSVPAGGGGRSGAAPSGGGGFTFSPQFSIDNQGSTPVQGEMQEETGSDGGRHFKLVLADEVGAALTQKAGGARRALRTGYGVKSKGTRR